MQPVANSAPDTWINFAWKLSGSMPDRAGNMPALP
jgi:hypothetical protein